MFSQFHRTINELITLFELSLTDWEYTTSLQSTITPKDKYTFAEATTTSEKEELAVTHRWNKQGKSLFW